MPDSLAPMSSNEYQRYYDCGLMPWRFWPEEFAKLREAFAQGELTLEALEDSLDDTMGITFLESMGYLPEDHS